MHPFIDVLQHALISEVRHDPVSLAVYSIDASIYEITPACVVLPRTKEELIKAVAIAGQFRVPVTARGAATGITGGCLGRGLIIDCSKYLNKIVQIDIERERAVVESGCVQDDLNEALAPFGYRLGPDTSTGNRATIGGMVGNNAAGSHALLFGRMVDHVEEVELVLAGGEVMRCRAMSSEKWTAKCREESQEGVIYRALERMRQEQSELIEREFPKVERRSSGYNLNELVKPNFSNLAKLVVGSEGTLGVISEIVVRIAKKPRHVGMAVLMLDNLVEGLRKAQTFLQYGPYALELIDRKIIEAGRESPALKGKMEWLKGEPEALFVVEFQAETQEALLQKCERFKEATAAHLILEEKPQEEVWQLRKAGLGLLLSKRSYSRAVAFIEDLVVPPEKLADFIQRLQVYLKSHGKEAGIYGHVGNGCLHIRPYMNVGKEQALMRSMMVDIAALVKEYGGSLSAEHGDGKIRSWLNPTMYGEAIYALFKEIKRAFDPQNLMNPGNIVGGDDFAEGIRQSPEKGFDTVMHFDGGVALHVDLCNGNGQCRKRDGLMCPSFQVTNDEKDTTRARAEALRAVMQGKVVEKDIHEVMDLCIQCKGCKTECPSQVDMAKLKAEYLHRQKKSLRDYLFGHIPTFLWLGSWMPRITNFMMKSGVMRFLGVAKERALPQLFKKRFSKMLSKGAERERKVVLFNDTFTEFTAGDIGLSAKRVLEAAGFEVIVPPYRCCGRTLISKGYLEEAKVKAQAVIASLLPYAEAGIPIVGIEPSCIFTLRDEMCAFGIEKAEVVAKATKTIEELLLEIDLPLKISEETILVHGHCHQKANIGTKATMQFLEKIKGAAIHEIPSGCCGMAGSFGFEKEHYEFSQKIGELKLFPEIREAPNATVVANGVSCRQQIHDAIGVRPVHTVELLEKLLQQ